MGAGDADAGGRTILLIEDDPHVSETLAELLGLEGYSVVLAPDAESGLVQARRISPDLVLCDLTLPGELDGHDFARVCRADPRLSGLRLVAVSGYCAPQDRTDAIEAGFDDLIPKPVDLARIAASFASPDGG